MYPDCKFVSIVSVAMFWIFSGGSIAFGFGNDTPATVETTGTATLKTSPDRLRLNVAIMAKGETIDEAIAKLAKRRSEITEALAGTGADPKSIRFGAPRENELFQRGLRVLKSIQSITDAEKNQLKEEEEKREKTGETSHVPTPLDFLVAVVQIFTAESDDTIVASEPMKEPIVAVSPAATAPAYMPTTPNPGIEVNPQPSMPYRIRPSSPTGTNQGDPLPAPPPPTVVEADGSSRSDLRAPRANAPLGLPGSANREKAPSAKNPAPKTDEALMTRSDNGTTETIEVQYFEHEGKGYAPAQMIPIDPKVEKTASHLHPIVLPSDQSLVEHHQGVAFSEPAIPDENAVKTSGNIAEQVSVTSVQPKKTSDKKPDKRAPRLVEPIFIVESRLDAEWPLDPADPDSLLKKGASIRDHVEKLNVTGIDQIIDHLIGKDSMYLKLIVDYPDFKRIADQLKHHFALRFEYVRPLKPEDKRDVVRRAFVAAKDHAGLLAAASGREIADLIWSTIEAADSDGVSTDKEEDEGKHEIKIDDGTFKYSFYPFASGKARTSDVVAIGLSEAVGAQPDEVELVVRVRARFALEPKKR